jgi:hypothetical protein
VAGIPFNSGNQVRYEVHSPLQLVFNIPPGFLHLLIEDDEFVSPTDDATREDNNRHNSNADADENLYFTIH